MSRPPICTGCQNCTRPLHQTELRCDRPLSDRRDPVTGRYSDTAGIACSDERASGRRFFGLGRTRCGPEGRFFAPVPEEERALPQRAGKPRLKSVK